MHACVPAYVSVKTLWCGAVVLWYPENCCNTLQCDGMGWMQLCYRQCSAVSLGAVCCIVVHRVSMLQLTQAPPVRSRVEGCETECATSPTLPSSSLISSASSFSAFAQIQACMHTWMGGWIDRLIGRSIEIDQWMDR